MSHCFPDHITNKDIGAPRAGTSRKSPPIKVLFVPGSVAVAGALPGRISIVAAGGVARPVSTPRNVLAYPVVLLSCVVPR